MEQQFLVSTLIHGQISEGWQKESLIVQRKPRSLDQSTGADMKRSPYRTCFSTDSNGSKYNL